MNLPSTHARHYLSSWWAPKRVCLGSAFFPKWGIDQPRAVFSMESLGRIRAISAPLIGFDHPTFNSESLSLYHSL